jgi:UDP-N-acetylmuramoyl-tripeptide--D-alanyl-D-alanine ligase
MNALAAAAAALEMGIPLELVQRGLAGVAPSGMRLERLEVGTLVVFNDAYNANPDAMAASLATFAELAREAPVRVAILGEMRELGSSSGPLHREVGAKAAQSLRAGDTLVAVGAEAEAVGAGATEAGFGGTLLVVDSLDQGEASDIARALAERLPAGAAILLKGSRGARMERFLEALGRVVEGAEPPTPA